MIHKGSIIALVLAVRLWIDKRTHLGLVCPSVGGVFSSSVRRFRLIGRLASYEEIRRSVGTVDRPCATRQASTRLPGHLVEA